MLQARAYHPIVVIEFLGLHQASLLESLQKMRRLPTTQIVSALM
jgi:hypothetical protein